MYAHEIEPVLFLSPWLVEFDLPITKSSEKTLIPDVAHAIEGQLCISFLYKHRLYLDIIRFRGSSIVIY